MPIHSLLQAPAGGPSYQRQFILLKEISRVQHLQKQTPPFCKKNFFVAHSFKLDFRSSIQKCADVMRLKKTCTAIKNCHLLVKILHFLIYIIIKILLCTYRIKVFSNKPVKDIFQKKVSPSTRDHLPRGIFYTWHQNIISAAVFFHKFNIKIPCIISPSKDGKFVGSLAKRIGFHVIYGSSYKEPIKLVRKSLKILKEQKRLFLIGDGSRGPAKKLKPGVHYFAKTTNLPLIFIKCEVSNKIVLRKTWDKFQIPLPFSKIAIFLEEQA